MKAILRSLCAVGIGLGVTLLAGCNGPQSPVVSPVVSPGVARPTMQTSWMSREAKAAPQLLYVTDSGDNQVSVLTLPQGKLVGTLSGFNAPYGECTNAAGDVFIVDLQAAQVWQFAHGAKSPKNILDDHGYYPIACSVDPKSGDLAVTNEIATSGRSGNIAVFPKATGKPKYYSDPNIEQFGFCAYDGNGNLFAGGGDSANQHLFAELPKGKQTLRMLTFNGTVNSLEPMQWDGQDLAVLDGDPGSLIYRFAISGDTGTEVGVLKLDHASEIVDFTIRDGTLYAPLYNRSEVAEYQYPRGGGVVKTFFGFSDPAGTAVSVLP